MIRKNTTAILFNGGGYGTYLEWVLTTLTTDISIMTPFNHNGNSHKFIGNHLLSCINEGWKNFVTSADVIPFIRLHPKTLKNDSLSTNLNLILDVVRCGIYLYPDRSSVVLNINNYYSKIWDSWFSEQFANSRGIDQNKIYDNWPVSRSIPMSDIPAWIKREFLSLYLMPAWFDQVEWYHPDKWSHDRCQLVLINELLYDFKNTILKIQKFCNLEFKKSIDDMVPFHNAMLTLQTSSMQDQLCDNIIDSIITKKVFDWSDQELPLPSQSWLQWELRNLGYEIRCDGLDKFPTNSVQLDTLLYNP